MKHKQWTMDSDLAKAIAKEIEPLLTKAKSEGRKEALQLIESATKAGKVIRDAEARDQAQDQQKGG